MPTIDHTLVVELAASYLLHSTLLLLLAWILDAGLSGNPRFRSALWRTALVLPVLTCVAAHAIGTEEWAWSPSRTDSSIAVSTQTPPIAEIAPRREPVAPTTDITEIEPLIVDPDEEWHVSIEPAVAPVDEDIPVATLAALPPAMTITTPAPRPAASRPALPPPGAAERRDFRVVWISRCVLATALLGVMLFTFRIVRDLLRLRGAVELADPSVQRRFERLLLRSGLRRVRLVVSQRVREPGACGVFRPTIVIPEGLCDSLAPGKWDAVLAHELAHLVRRDPFWLACARLLSAVTVWQPLNRLAVRRWRRATEHVCDEWAIRHGVPAMTLARGLAEVADWRLNGGHAIGLTAAGNPSELARRIKRLTGPAPRPRRTIHRSLILGTLSISLALAGPRLSLTDASPPATEQDAAVEVVLSDVAAESTELVIATDSQSATDSDRTQIAELIDDLRRLDQLLAAGPSDPKLDAVRARISRRLDDIQQQLGEFGDSDVAEVVRLRTSASEVSPPTLKSDDFSDESGPTGRNEH